MRTKLDIQRHNQVFCRKFLLRIIVKDNKSETFHIMGYSILYLYRGGGGGGGGGSKIPGLSSNNWDQSENSSFPGLWSKLSGIFQVI